MTVVIGMMSDKGPILATDEQVTGASKSSRDKILSIRGRGAMVDFAMAGNKANATMAVQECLEAIREMPPEARSVKAIRTVIKKTVEPIQARYVDARPLAIRNEFVFDLVVAVRTREEVQGRLLYVQDGAVSEADGWVCLGSGGYLAEYIVKQAYEKLIDWNRGVVLAMRALAAAKSHDAACGGQSQIAVCIDGRTAVVPHSVAATEAKILEFESAAAWLLSQMANPAIDEEGFAKSLQNFNLNVTRWRAQIIKEGAEMRNLDTWFRDQFAKEAAPAE